MKALKVAELSRLLGSSEFRPMPSASHREAWRTVARRPWIRALMPDLIGRAEALLSEPVPLIRATDYLSFFRTGLRNAHSAPSGRRSEALSVLTAAECIEGKGRFLDALLDASWAVAEETSWIMPPHLGSEVGEQLPDADAPLIDLRVAGVGKQLAETLYLLGDRMDAVSPMWRRRINSAIRRQVVEPYLSRSFWWEKATLNWNAVCTDGVVAAVLLADFDRDTRARVIRKALRSVPHFLSGFTPDGGCTEGPGYWHYGVSRFASLAYCLHCATGGAVDLLADPLVARILSYPPGVILAGSKVANFADCPREVGFRSGPVAWAAARAGAVAMVRLASRSAGGRPYLGSALDLWLMPRPRRYTPPTESFFPDLMLLVARGPGAEGRQIVLAAKGGHNAEHHNHNDVGSFIVHWRGESLVCDLGAGDYTMQLFSPRRYELLFTRSAGHNVPLVNGVEQGTGRQFRARMFEQIKSQGATGVRMDLTRAYPPQAGLKALRRQLVLHRGQEGFVELVDEVEFADTARRYELPLYSEGALRLRGDGIVEARRNKAALRIQFDPALLEARLDAVEHYDARFRERFGETLPRCTLVLRADAPRAAVRVLFVPV
jgi:hypothetical protein